MKRNEQNIKGNNNIQIGVNNVYIINASAAKREISKERLLSWLCASLFVSGLLYLAIYKDA
jgi:hypothetical protein